MLYQLLDFESIPLKWNAEIVTVCIPMTDNVL